MVSYYNLKQLKRISINKSLVFGISLCVDNQVVLILCQAELLNLFYFL